MPKIVKNGRTYGGSSPNSALYTSYDNTGSTLDSTNVQSAISELDDNMQHINPIQTMTQQEYDDLPDSKLTDGVVRFVTGADGDDINASNVVYNNATSHLPSTNVQGAIDSLNVNLTQLFTLGTDNGWNYRKWSNGYFEAWKKDIRNATGQSKSVMGLTGDAFTKTVPYPSFITKLQQVISAISNVKVGNGYSIQVYQNVVASGITIETMSNTTGEQSYESTHYIYGRLSTTLSAPPTE